MRMKQASVAKKTQQGITREVVTKRNQERDLRQEESLEKQYR